jgi:hypothetical protein
MALFNANLEGQQIALARRPLGDGDVDRVAPALLVVERVVLDVADHVLRLRALNEPRDQRSGQDGIFAEVLKRPAVARFARNVHAAAQGHVVALRAQFRADQLAVFIGRVGVPTGGRGHVGGQRRGVAAIGAAGAHAVSSVAHIDAGNAQRAERPPHSRRRGWMACSPR